MSSSNTFDIIDTTISDIHEAFQDGQLTARQLVQTYLDRIEAYDKNGPQINSVISINPHALEDADRLDKALADGGMVGPLHGIPLLMKDQADVDGMPTTMGSVMFKDHNPGRDCTIAAKLKEAGAIFLGKAALGEMGAGDTHGSLFGSTRNVYDQERTAGGSSGGSGAAVSANFATICIGQEGFASIRRPSIWNGVAGMRPTAGLVSRHGVYAGWPMINGSLGPMSRTVTDLAKLLDCMVGYDPADPITARGVGKTPESYAALLDKNALKGARIGILRESMGHRAEPDSDDFAKITAVFDSAVDDLANAGADIVDPVEIPGLNDLLAQRARSNDDENQSYADYAAGTANPPFKSRAEIMASPLFKETAHGVQLRWKNEDTSAEWGKYLHARDLLMTRFLAVMADHKLDAIVHKAVEHQPTLIKDGVNPPYIDQWGAPHINTFLIFVPSVVVPAGFTSDNLPGGITFLGRPYDDENMIRFAYAYEQATNHRRIPECAP
ncbi:MAG: amidase [Rhodospirillaceae bacterium]|nr:amidase [Rhodospirillaceae bacterium]|tara:strand:- start:3330 stop:4820 length:1491 start_codon:yes stop_codon:yes gene_type:complete